MPRKKILITVKAYPNPSRKYVETVCCAGVDLETNHWIRLYPIPYRDLDSDKRFKKYSVIEVSCSKATDDKRRESYKIDVDSIKIVDQWDTRDKWERRKAVVLPTLEKSMCDVLRLSEESDLSLALVKPSAIDFLWKKARAKDKGNRKKCYAQPGFFEKHKQEIEQIPHTFYYTFSCENEKHCRGHTLIIVDWEINQAYRSWRQTYSNEDILLDKIRETWLTNMCSVKKDTYFFVGNMQRFRGNFMILGVFYPPKKIDK